MLTSSNFKSNKNKQVLVIFSIASLFLFGLVLKAEAKVISVGTTTDTVYMGGSLGIGITNPGYKLEIAAPTASNLIPAAVFHLTGGQAWGNVLSLMTDASAGVDEPRLLFNYANGTKSWSIGGYNTGAPNTFSIWEDSNGTWGTQRLTVIPGGNVGIGITNPTAKLDVKGASTGSVIRATVTDGLGSADFGYGFFVENQVETGAITSNYTNSGSGGWANMIFKTRNGALNEKMRITDVGNVGVGTTAPGTKLDVSGSFRNTTATTHSLLGGAGNTVVMADNTGALYNTPIATFMSANGLWNGTKNGTIWNGDAGVGNVGIGTTNPGYPLQISATSGDTRNAGIFLNDAAVYNPAGANTANKVVSGIRFNWYSENWQVGAARGGGVDIDGLVFSRNGSEKLVINSAGNVGIGTTNPLSNLDIGGANPGSFSISSGGSIDLKLRGGSDYNAIDSQRTNDLHFQINSVNKMTLQGATGNVGIGITNPGATLDVAGNIKSNHLVQGSLVSRPYATWGAGGSSTGAVIIKLPGAVGNYGMVHMQIDVYEYSAAGATTYICGGHNWNSRWYSYSCNAIGVATKKIRLAVKDGQYAVVLGDNTSTWSYGQVILSKVINGSYYSGTMDLGGTYTITQDASAESYTWISEDLSGLRSHTFQNYSATTHSLLAGAGNTVVMADNNGTLYNTPLATFASTNSLWGGTKNGNIWNGDAGAGSVGIGITNPAQKLDVNGNIIVSPVSSSWAEGLAFSMPTTSTWGGLRWRRERGNNDGNWYVGYTALDGTDDLVFGANNGGGQVDNIFRLTKTGNVGIGTAVPGSSFSWASPALELSGSRASLGLTSSGSLSTIRFKTPASDSEMHLNFDDPTGSLMFGAYKGGYKDVMVIKGGGNVGIGTTNPSVRLDVQGGRNTYGTNVYGAWTADGNSLIRNWALNDGPNNYTGTYTTVSDSPLGSKTMRYTSNTYFRNDQWVPVDITKTYKVSVWGRTISGTPNNYLSLTQATSDLSQPVNGGWGNPYWGVVNQPFPTSWTYYTMTIGPSGSGADYSWAADTRYVQLGALMIYTGSGVCELTGYKIEEVTNTLQANTTALGNLVANGSFRNSLATTHSLLGGAGNKVVMTDNSGNLYTGSTSGSFTDNLYINNGAPTIYFQDTDERTTMLHNNSNLFYLLTGSGVNSTSWTTNGSYWPIVVNLTNDDLNFGGNAYFNEGGVTISGSNSTGDNLKVGGVRGTFSGEYIQLYNKVGIGSPAGWGTGNTETPVYGLSTYGGANLAYNQGSVGIGTTAPGAKLDVALAGVYNTPIIRAVDNGHSIGLGVDSNSTYWGGEISVDGTTIANFENRGMNIGQSFIEQNSPFNGIAVEGNVGIGTTNPGTKLDVDGDITQTVTHGNNVKLKLPSNRNGGGTGEVSLYSWISEPGVSWTGGGIARNMYNGSGFPRVNTGLSGQMMRFNEGNNIEFTVETAAGSRTTPVVISPSFLEVAGTFRNSNATTHSLLGGSGNVVVMADNSGTLYTSTAASSLLWGGSTGGNIWNANSGNVGIGTTNPNSKITLIGRTSISENNYLNNGAYSWASEMGATWGAWRPSLVTDGIEITDYYGGNDGTDAKLLFHDYGYGGPRFRFNGPSDYTLFLEDWAGDYFRHFRISGVTDMTVDGNVGINTTAPDAKLDILNGAMVNTTSTYSAHYRNVLTTYIGDGGSTGTMKIVLPKPSDTMVDITIKGYDYSSIGAWEVRVSGYLYGGTGGGWYVNNHKVQIIGSAPFSSVRLAWDGSKPMILLGNTSTNWSYGSVVVSDFITSFRGVNGWATGWSASVISNESGITTIATPTIYTYITPGGSVGIGKTNPGANLDVVGTINSSMSVNSTSLCIGGVCKTDWNSLVPISGNVTLTGPLTIPGLSLTGDLDLNWHNIRNVTKLTVGTIDPLYNIKGVNYATFAPSVAGGVKEEYIGKAKINNKNAEGEYEFVVDFDSQKEGSDLWVWRHTVDFSDDNVQVLITPSGKKANIYYVIAGNKLTLKSDIAVTASYHLIGNRIDWKKWPTRAVDQTEKASFIIK